MDPGRDVPTPAQRRDGRVAWRGAARLRGVCGDFDARAADVSAGGVRLRLDPAWLHVPEDACLSTVAAAVQVRLGSRFPLELGTQGARVRRRGRLVRMAVGVTREPVLELGCAFEVALEEPDFVRLGVRPERAASEGGRCSSTWAREGRGALDPALAAEKIEHLFDVPGGALGDVDERRPRRALTALLRPREGRCAPPLLSVVETLAESTALLCLRGAAVDDWRGHGTDLSTLVGSLVEHYGEWPRLEILDGARRLWHGPTRICGLAFEGERALLLRVLWGRRPRPAELERLCSA